MREVQKQKVDVLIKQFEAQLVKEAEMEEGQYRD
jgi:hypothetical protein